jgi:membrane fusion protein (multidrug efflux system)
MSAHRLTHAGIVLGLASCLAVLAGCGRAEGQAAAKGDAPQGLPVTAIRMAMRSVPISLEAVGQAEGSREVEIRARVNGILEKRAYEEGATVAAGELLFVIDPAPYELAVAQARAALQQERVRKELAEIEAKRLAPLAEDKAIPRREVDQANATAKQAAAAILSAQARLDEAELHLSYTRIRAPIAGVTGRALKSEGSLVTAGTESSLLTTITQVDPVWVRFSLAERDYAAIRGAARDARVQLVAADGRVAADGGRLNFAGSTVDARLGTVQMRAAFANPVRKWLPGQYLKVRVLAGEQAAMLVPQSALLQGEQSRYVFTVGADGKAAPKPVSTASFIGADAVVTGGLAEGDLVIVDNLVKVRPGTPVKVR